MTSRLRPLPLQELRLLPEGVHWQVDQPIADLESLTPVRGLLQLIHRADVLEVACKVETIVSLCCDRCLQAYKHPLGASVCERLQVAVAEGPELEAAVFLAEDPVERLDPSGVFDPERWLFEQLSLQLPLVNRCGADCPGPPLQPSGDGADDQQGDPRWAALRSLR
jgi:uncharacterized protein